MMLEVIRQFALCIKSRTEAIIIYAWLSAIALFIACGGLPPSLLALKVFGAMAGTALGVYFYNDLRDLGDDVLRGEEGGSAPSGRPLGRGLVSKRIMGSFAAVVAFFGVAMAALINIRVLLLQLAFLILGIIYSTEPIRLKKRFLAKQVTIALGGIIACLSGGMAVGAITGPLLYLAALYVAFTFGVNPLVDLRDMGSDRDAGVRTIPVVWGPGLTIRLALATFMACAVSTWVGFYGLGFNVALPVLGTIVLAAWAYVVYPLLERWSDVAYLSKVLFRRVLPLYFVLQIVVLVGSLPL